MTTTENTPTVQIVASGSWVRLHITAEGAKFAKSARVVLADARTGELQFNAELGASLTAGDANEAGTKRLRSVFKTLDAMGATYEIAGGTFATVEAFRTNYSI